jgi:hypothetical protein
VYSTELSTDLPQQLQNTVNNLLVVLITVRIDLSFLNVADPLSSRAAAVYRLLREPRTPRKGEAAIATSNSI